MSINIPTALKANITVNHGELKPVVEWCERNCKDEWKFMEDINDQYNGFEFFFESERDYVAFLMWKK
jgi:hypothetical protein